MLLQGSLSCAQRAQHRVARVEARCQRLVVVLAARRIRASAIVDQAGVDRNNNVEQEGEDKERTDETQ